jgi:hypothetical protein
MQSSNLPAPHCKTSPASVCPGHVAVTTARTLTKFAAHICRLSLRILAHARFLGKVDLPLIMTDNTENLLNLPGKLPFFPTKTTDPGRVNALIRRLHPVVCDKELIRLGPNGDGGYLVPDDLEGIVACFSPGVSNVVGFERDCALRGMKVFMADASVGAPPQPHPRFTFIKKFIGSTTQGEFVSFEEWVDESVMDSHGDLLLQMDIEGSEYETLLSMPRRLQQRFRIIVAEFHYLDYLFSEPIFAVYSKVFEKLLNTHTCVHIHPNNVSRSLKVGELEIPQMAELTFLRNDRVSQAMFATQFPHALDRDNVERPPLHLPKSCYRA